MALRILRCWIVFNSSAFESLEIFIKDRMLSKETAYNF